MARAGTMGLGTLALARHDFATALAWEERAREVNPAYQPALGVIGNAQRRGRYEAAAAAAQAMVDLRPDLVSVWRSGESAS